MLHEKRYYAMSHEQSFFTAKQFERSVTVTGIADVQPDVTITDANKLVCVLCIS
jgi:hypothetical protein